MMRSAFSEFTMTIEDILAEGDRVVVRAKMPGTHQGDFMGIPVTGRQIDVAFADFLRFEGGKVVEHWGVTDTGAMMEQLNG
jgi:predicted ester cyclase